VKASAPIFVLVFAVFFRLAKLSWGIVTGVVLISVGELIVCVNGDLDLKSLIVTMRILSPTMAVK